MFAPERKGLIQKIVREHQRMNFADLQRMVKVSPATLRRDLTELEQSGGVIRVHGGVLHPAYARSEISFDERRRHNRAAKAAIAARAVSFIPSGASVFVDAGSTCLEAGKILVRRKDIRLITHSATLVAQSLHGEASLLCVGGELRHVSGALTGGSALNALTSLRADFALIGASGLSAEGAWTTELSEAEMKQAILGQARRRMLLADSTKWDVVSTVCFAEWGKFTDWITEQTPPARERRSLGSALKIHVC